MDESPFRTGPWSGFYVYSADGKRHAMSLGLAFREGRISGAGEDDIGRFAIQGRYDRESLHVHWTKTYLGRHSVFYKGYGEPARIWGTWELAGLAGGFMIRPGDGGCSIRESACAEELIPDAVSVRDS